MAEQIYSEVIDTFYGGIADDVRSQNLAYCALSQNFDIWTNPKRLTPYRSVEADETTSYRISLFAYADSRLYGRGKKTNASTSEAKVYAKTANQALTSSWAALTTAESTNTLTGDPSLFLKYHDWLFGNTALRIWAYEPSSNTFTEEAVTGVSNSVQGIITSDDMLLVPNVNSIYKKDGEGTGPDDLWSEAIEFNNTDRQVNDLCEWGDYVAIALHPGGNFPAEMGSRVAIWDKVSEDATQMVDWGNGHIEILDNIDGVLIGVSINTFIDEGEIQNKLVVREWAGGTKAKVIFELEGGSGATLRVGPNYTKTVEEGKFSFQVKITIDGVAYIQMATIGRKNANYPISFTLSRLADNGTSVTEINGAFKMADTVWFAHNTDGSVNRTNNDGSYGDAFYITNKLNGSGRVSDAAARTKALLSAGLSLVPLPAGATASLYYRTNANSSWTLIRTYSDDNDLGSMAGKTNADTDFDNYKELQFKAVSTGGAEITGINWKWRFVSDDIGE